MTIAGTATGGTASAPIALAASGTIVASVAGKRIRVFGAAAVALAATGIKFQSNATDITGVLSLAANGGVVWPGNVQPWFQTAVGEALNLNMSAATTVGGVVIYDVV